MTWKLYPIEQFPAVAEAWDRLQAETTRTAFLESAFLQPLIDEFATGRERIGLWSDAGTLRVATIVKPTGRGMWEGFQPSQLPLAAWIAPRERDLIGDARSLIAALPGLAIGLGIPQLDPLLQQRPCDEAHGRTQDYIQTSWVDIEASFEAYWESRGKNLKQNVRKQRNKLHADGVALQIECVRDPARVAAAIADYGSLENAGWKASNGTAVRPDNAQGRFYRKMLENFCRAGRGRIYRYTFNGKVVSMDLCIDNGAVIVILKTTYDESYKGISPSTLMRQDEFRALFEEERFQRIEFYGKVMEWHRRWTSSERTLYHATVYRWPVLCSLHVRLKRVRKPELPGARAGAPDEVASP